MIKTIAIIPARAGSKRLPNKNKKELCGKPLLCWTIDEAIRCNVIDLVVVSTNDQEIIQFCKERYEPLRNFKCIKRPEWLAEDNSPQFEVIKDVMSQFREEFKIILLLQPTSPLRTKEDILKAYQLFELSRKSVISVYKESELTYKRNGAIFIDWWYRVFKNKGFKDERLYLMPKERSVDIDYLEDFKQCEEYLQEKRGNING